MSFFPPGFHLYQPTLPACLSLLIKIIDSSVPPVSSILQTPLNQLLHIHSVPDYRHVIHYPPALFSGRISWYLTCLLSLTTSPHLCPGNLTCLQSLDFAFARSLSACSLDCLDSLFGDSSLILNLDCALRPGFLIVDRLAS